jgi:hypothetical protein
MTQRPPSTTQGRDVFRARRGTYRPNPNRVPYPIYGYDNPLYGYEDPYYGYDEPVYPGTPQIVVVPIPRQSLEPPSVAPAPVPYVPGPPGPDKTFYVIPRCYAGDRPPQPESLAPDCDISLLRVVPPS